MLCLDILINFKKYIVVFGCLFPFCVFAGVSNVTLEGIVVKYDKNTVTLSQKGKHIKVSREAIPKHFKLKTGKKVYAVFNSQEIMKKIRKSREQEQEQKKSRTLNSVKQ